MPRASVEVANAHVLLLAGNVIQMSVGTAGSGTLHYPSDYFLSLLFAILISILGSSYSDSRFFLGLIQLSFR